MSAFVQGASMRLGAPVHILDHEDGMDSVTACGRRLFYANHVYEADPLSLCARCVVCCEPSGCTHPDSTVAGRCGVCGQSTDLAEQGRQLASERDDLIAQGVDPGELEVPLHPQSTDLGGDVE